jgi:hypothetical protein
LFGRHVGAIEGRRHVDEVARLVAGPRIPDVLGLDRPKLDPAG